jgi:hypothetical protein
MAGKLCECLQLCGRLAAAVAAVLEEPSCEHSQDVHDAVRLRFAAAVVAMIYDASVHVMHCKHNYIAACIHGLAAHAACVAGA